MSSCWGNEKEDMNGGNNIAVMVQELIVMLTWGCGWDILGNYEIL